jgi:hypothetical protein
MEVDVVHADRRAVLVDQVESRAPFNPNAPVGRGKPDDVDAMASSPGPSVNGP